MIEQILIDACAKARNGEIHLGTANGWGREMSVLYTALSECKIPDSGSSRNLGRCYNEYSFDVLIEDQTYVVVYSVDSGD